MNTLVAQHPLLCLLATFLLGFTVKFLLDIYLLRERLYDAEAAVRRRGEELDSERYVHGRTQVDLKNRSAELAAAQKSGALLASQAASLKARLADTETELARVGEARTALQHGLASTSAQLAVAVAEARGQASEIADLRLRADVRDAELATSGSTIEALRGNLARAVAEAAALAERIPRLEHDLGAQTTKADALGSDLQQTLRSLADAQASGGEALTALTAAQSMLTAVRAEKAEAEAAMAKNAAAAAQEAGRLAAALTKAEKENAASRAHVEKLETALKDARADVEPVEQKLKARQDEVKQLSALLGEANEELAALRTQHAQVQANHKATLQTRATLEAEVQIREGQVATMREKLDEVEAELRATSEAHARLQAELAERPAPVVVPPAAPVMPAAPAADAALLAELELMTRERNEMAAELASLRSAAPPAPRRAKRPAAEPEPEPEEFFAACPQHLSDVEGIGPTYEQKLHAVGVGSYWELSQLSDADIAEALDLTETERSVADLDGIRIDAARLARETKSVGRRWNGSEPDGLAQLEGIGPAAEKKLHDAGICTFETLARTSAERLAEIWPGTPQRPVDHMAWVVQAAARAAARENP
jgi:predicted flap endonuclease-1-like 5' DNA nuclease/predicted  nucleic acid-binding Zn-ribbon protein